MVLVLIVQNNTLQIFQVELIQMFNHMMQQCDDVILVFWLKCETQSTMTPDASNKSIIHTFSFLLHLRHLILISPLKSHLGSIVEYLSKNGRLLRSKDQKGQLLAKKCHILCVMIHLSQALFLIIFRGVNLRMAERQTLMLVVSRLDLDPNLIPPLKVIIPMLGNLYPVRVFTSIDGEVKPTKTSTIYQQLVRKLQGNNLFCCLTKTLEDIIKQCDKSKLNSYRVCILGHERADWSVIMEFKRRGIVIDTVCSSNQKNQMLVQISYITSGVHKIVKESTMIKNFQGELGLNSKMRSYFKIQKKETVEFSLKCTQCPTQVTGAFFACSVCLSVYCQKHQHIKQCWRCGYLLD